MSQSSVIAFALIAGFVVYITMRGELPAYLYVLGLGPAPSGNACVQGSAAGGTGASGGVSSPTSPLANPISAAQSAINAIGSANAGTDAFGGAGMGAEQGVMGDPTAAFASGGIS